MPNVPNNVNRTMVTHIEGAIGPIMQCAIWSGTKQVSATGATSALGVTTKVIPPTTPYLSYNVLSPCTGGSGIGPSVGLQFIPNGYTGIVNFNVTTTDAAGFTSTSNTVSYTLVAGSALQVDAGPDVNVVSNTYSGFGATATGGTGTKAYAWTYIDGPSAATPTITPSTALNPTFGGLLYNGVYEFQITATDSLPATDTDTFTITRTGGVSPLLVTAAAITPYGGGTYLNRTMSVTVSGGTSPYTWTIVDSGTTGCGCQPDGYYSGTFSGTSTTHSINMSACTSYDGLYAYVYIEVTDNAGQTANSSLLGIVRTCFVEGTPIMLADGSETPVETLKISDEVMGTNILTYEENGADWSFQYPEIKPETTGIKTISSFDVPRYINFNDKIKVTESHPLLIYRTYEYLFCIAGNILITDKFVDKNGGLIDITSINIVNETVKVYSFDTEPWNTYIASGIVSHNKVYDVC